MSIFLGRRFERKPTADDTVAFVSVCVCMGGGVWEQAVEANVETKKYLFGEGVLALCQKWSRALERRQLE